MTGFVETLIHLESRHSYVKLALPPLQCPVSNTLKVNLTSQACSYLHQNKVIDKDNSIMK